MIPYSRQSISENDIDAVTKVLKSDMLTQGQKGEEFENALCEKFSVDHAVVCSSGTAALHLSYQSLGVGKGSIGIVPAITFAATANCFHYLGARVRFCDVNPETGLLCLQSLESILTESEFKRSDSKGLISPVSFAGAVPALHSINEYAQKSGFKIVEDASHSPGAYYQCDQINYSSASCIHSETACLSFHPVKHICTGEGGAVLSNCSKLADSARRLRSHGISRPFSQSHETPWFYEQTELGWNYRLTDFQSALGMSQLNRLNDQILKRIKIATKYNSAFAQAPFEHFFKPMPQGAGHAYHLYIILFHDDALRDKAHKFLKDRDVITQVHYIPLYRHPYYERIYGKIRLAGAEKFYQSCLSIPMYPTLESTEQNIVIEQLGKFCNSL